MKIENLRGLFTYFLKEMASKTEDLKTLIDQYSKAFDEVNSSISNIKDVDTLKRLKKNIKFLTRNSKKNRRRIICLH